MVTVQCVEAQVVLMVMASFPNLCVSDDPKFNGVPQCHSQAAAPSQADVHTGGETKQ